MRKKIAQILKALAQHLDPIQELKISEQTRQIWAAFAKNKDKKRKVSRNALRYRSCG